MIRNSTADQLGSFTQIDTERRENAVLCLRNAISSRFAGYDLSSLQQLLDANASLNEIINFLFEMLNENNLNYLNKSNGESSQASSSFADDVQQNVILKALVDNVDELLANMKTAQSNRCAVVVCVLLKLIRKYFRTSKLFVYYANFMKFLKLTKNENIMNELLSMWNIQVVRLDAITSELLPHVKKNLGNHDHRIRSKCLQILAFHYSKHEMFADNKIIKVLLNFTDDQDPRVRMTALQLMITLHLNKIHVSVEYYDEIRTFLEDDFFQIRLLSTQLICLMAFNNPEHLISSDQSGEERIRFIDEVFSKVCNMMNDISVEVKTCAGSLLGKFQSVSSKYLLQTLDKKFMSNLKVRDDLKQRQLLSSEWTTTLPSLAPSSDAVIKDDDNLHLITFGSCGAFIHGLEDEYLEVRKEAVDSLCELAANRPELAAKSIDFLVDMFNDEIEIVRLRAILALKRVSHYVLLGDDQADIVLSVIEDGSSDIRESLRELLSSCKLATKIGLKKTIQALFTNLKKYPMDKYSIWKCFKSLGANHSKFVLSLVSYLVSLHPFIDVIEPDINDFFYIGSLILIFNGVHENSAILSMLPKYIMNHYLFVKLKLPDLVPDIKLIENSPISIASIKDIEF